ncbi:CZB domain-containing protein [Gammaproteobacteria bacterium]
MTKMIEIDDAISAHGNWKVRLKRMISSGEADTSVETIRQDNQCAFGQWLYGPTLTTGDKASSHYKAVKDLHAEFHKAAARVATLALCGKKAEAEKMMAMGGEYALISAKLTQAMIAWKAVAK